MVACEVVCAAAVVVSDVWAVTSAVVDSAVVAAAGSVVAAAVVFAAAFVFAAAVVVASCGSAVADLRTSCLLLRSPSKERTSSQPFSYHSLND